MCHHTQLSFLFFFNLLVKSFEAQQIPNFNQVQIPCFFFWCSIWETAVKSKVKKIYCCVFFSTFWDAFKKSFKVLPLISWMVIKQKSNYILCISICSSLGTFCWNSFPYWMVFVLLAKSPSPEYEDLNSGFIILLPHSLYYCSTVGNCEIRTCKSSNSGLFQDCTGYSRLLKFLNNYMYKEASQGFHSGKCL